MPLEHSACRVLYLDHTAKLSGGELALSRLLAALDPSLVVPLVILGEEGPLTDMLRGEGIETHVFPLISHIRMVRKDTLGFQGWLQRMKHISPLWQYALKIVRFARENQIDIIYTNSLKSDLYGGLAGRLAGLPVIWHVRDRIEESYLPTAAVRLFRLLARRLPTCVVANSQSTLDTLQLPPTALTQVIASGLTQEYIQRCEEPHFPHSLPQIGIVGRIASWKGQDIFLRAAARVLKSGQKAHFRVIGAPLFGEDQQLVALRLLACELEIEDHVTFCGFQPDIPSRLRNLDILVHASTLPEPFGQVIVEGMVAGIPVIATDGGGAREIVTHEQTGLLVPLADIEALTASLLRLLDDAALGARLAARGKEHVLQNYTIEISARKSEALYERVLQRTKPLRNNKRASHMKDSLVGLIYLLALEIFVASCLQSP